MKFYKSSAALVLFLLSVSAWAEPNTLSSVSELGLVSTGGNTSALTLNIKEDLTYEWTSDIIKGRASYLKTQSNDIDSARNWLLGARYERVLSDGFNAFLAETVEGDTFAGYLQRYNTDLGAKYFFRKKEFLQWFVEAGYRNQAQNNLSAVKTSTSFARLYMEYVRSFTPTASVKYWLEYLPQLSQLSTRQMNTEISFTMAFAPSFALKTAYLIRYNSAAIGALGKTTDTVFTNSLVAKF